MKKLLLTGGLIGAMAFAFLPSLALASTTSTQTSSHTITRAEVQAAIPQFYSTLSALSTTTAYIQSRMATEDALFATYSTQLQAWSTRLSQGTPLSQAEMASMSSSLANMNQQLTVSAAWRAQVNSLIGNITTILSNISNIISRAV